MYIVQDNILRKHYLIIAFLVSFFLFVNKSWQHFLIRYLLKISRNFSDLVDRLKLIKLYIQKSDREILTN